MDRKDKPYLPLYVQDFMTDEKVRECAAESIGVYVFILCLLHKQTDYGSILLKQKDKQTDKQILNFATKFALHLPYQVDIIERSLFELLEYDVIQIDGDKLSQKRMVRDWKLSNLRSKIGSIGGKISAKKFAKAKTPANDDIDNDIDNESKVKVKKVFVPPTLEQVIAYFKENGKPESIARDAFKYYSTGEWKDSYGKQVINWKQKMIANWFKQTVPQGQQGERKQTREEFERYMRNT